MKKDREREEAHIQLHSLPQTYYYISLENTAMTNLPSNPNTFFSPQARAYISYKLRLEQINSNQLRHKDFVNI
jgi:hypothetical protein